MPGQGPNRTGNNEFEERITPETVGTLEQAWTAEGSTQPVVSQYGVVVGVYRFVRTYDPETGALRWSVPPDYTGDAIIAREIVVDGDDVHVTGYGLLATTAGDGSQGNGVRAIPLRGTRRDCGPAEPVSGLACPTWATPLDGTTTTSAVISDDRATLYVGTDAGTLHALDAATGAIRWTAAIGSPITATPALVRETLLVPARDGRLHAVAAGGCGNPSCESVWSAEMGGVATVQPAAGGGVVFTGSDGGHVRALAASGCGEPSCPALWDAELGSTINGLAVSGGRVFVTTADARLAAFEPTT